jgi:hypothetical protein
MSGLLPQLEVNCVSSIGRLNAFIVLVEAANSYGYCAIHIAKILLGRLSLI